MGAARISGNSLPAVRWISSRRANLFEKGDLYVGEIARPMVFSRSTQKNIVYSFYSADYSHSGKHSCTTDSPGYSEAVSVFLRGKEPEYRPGFQSAGHFFGWIFAEVLDCCPGGLSLHHRHDRDATAQTNYSVPGGDVSR